MVNILRPKQNGHHFADDIFQFISFRERFVFASSFNEQFIMVLDCFTLHNGPRLFHAPTRTTSRGCLMLHRTVHALWNLYGNPYRNRAEKEEETVT